jgi:hypothetical protein
VKPLKDGSYGKERIGEHRAREPENKPRRRADLI